jgi:EAL domain-containing protein (putative c-di-GMP-specific phosphodiesterase class I)
MSPPRLLVVDDQRLDRAIATHAAAQVGYVTTSAASISECRDLLEAGERFAVIVLDLSLGSEDGLAVLPILSRLTPDAVVVLASGFDGRILNASKRLATSLGLQVAGVLRKPILPTALQRILCNQPDAQDAGSYLPINATPGDMRAALDDGLIQAWFQPKTNLETSAIIGAEALARWITKDGVSIPPVAFVPIAERHGMIAELTDTMLDQSIRACARWRESKPECWVAVNVSPILLDDPELTDRIEARLQQHGVPPHALVLEITETGGIPDTREAIEILTRLRIRGVNLSIDDFGTGHSSMRSLVRVPFNEMKIDQSFVREAISSRDSRKVVRASASLGRELGLKVVAEGVETSPMAKLVEEAGCHVGQGYLYGRAMKPDVFEARLATEMPDAVVQSVD